VHTKSMDFGFYEQFCGGINLISFFFFSAADWNRTPWKSIPEGGIPG